MNVLVIVLLHVHFVIHKLLDFKKLKIFNIPDGLEAKHSGWGKLFPLFFLRINIAACIQGNQFRTFQSTSIVGRIKFHTTV